MLLTPLLLLSYPLALIASPLSERSSLVHGDISTSDASAIVERKANVSPVKRLLKRADTLFNALGTFGPLGLLGSIDASGNAVAATSNGDNDDNPADQPTFVCIGKCGAAAAVYLAALGIEATISFLKHLLSFHNNSPDWPTYPNGDALWSIRTFRNTNCGRPGVRSGIDPLDSDSTGPYMMSEYKSVNFNYHDNKPCENFMFADPKNIDGVEVQSVAVWLHPSVQDGYIFLYTSPVCDASVDNNKTQNQFTSLDSNLVSIYNGQGALFEGDDTPSTVGPGVWACMSSKAATWNAFSVVRIGTTDMTIPTDYYQNGHIPGSETQPKNRAAGQGANNYKHTPWAAYTWEQVGPAPYNALADPETYAIGETLGY